MLGKLNNYLNKMIKVKSTTEKVTNYQNIMIK